ncbi:helix-turn-helix domain-containing protein [Methylobacterium aquaticum]|uniref:helix-turn-helix domain-containing protein n=1 Tax=Methylobacterium aquaticum TaxID=270351 RepID=UPI003D171D46
MLREFDTHSMADRDQIGHWRAAVAESLVDVDCRLDRREPFVGAFKVFSAGECGLATLTGSCHEAARDSARIRRTGGEFFMLFLQQTGRMGVEIDDREFTVQPGDFFFYDASVPHRLIFREPFEHIAVRVPRPLVSQNWRLLQQRGCFQLTPKEPLSRIAAAALEASANSLQRMSADDLGIAVENVIDLFSAGASKACPEASPADGRSGSVTFARARAIIQARLRDPDLTPDEVARELRISRRALNKLFEGQGIGPMEYVILERLEQAARDLSSPGQRGASVTEIAFRWGFKNTSHFAKRFRQHFGKMPTELRQG